MSNRSTLSLEGEKWYSEASYEPPEANVESRGPGRVVAVSARGDFLPASCTRHALLVLVRGPKFFEMGTGSRWMQFVVGLRLLQKRMSSDYYTKTFTRDQSYVIVEAWCYAHQQGMRSWQRGAQPTTKPWILYMTDGAMEEWNSVAHYRWMSDALQRHITSDPDFVHKAILSYKQQLSVVEASWQRTSLQTYTELRRFIDQCFVVASLFVIWYYASTDERTPKLVRNEAMDVRERDVFFDEADRIFRSTYRKLYPAAKGLEATIVRKELRRAPPLRTMRLRKEHSVVISGHPPVVMTIDRFLERNPTIRFRYDKASQRSGDTTITGQAVFPGIKRGRVRVIRRIDQCNKVRLGDILVSPMTTPNFLPAMQRAAAFVTDEGGLTCHAVIVAREMKKPCVIGTKVATEVLKDGDRVEVDAERGIVRKL